MRLHLKLLVLTVQPAVASATTLCGIESFCLHCVTKISEGSYMGTKLVSISIAVTLAVFAVSWLGDQTGSSLYGLPLMAAMALGVFIVQWIGLIRATF